MWNEQKFGPVGGATQANAIPWPDDVFRRNLKILIANSNY